MFGKMITYGVKTTKKVSVRQCDLGAEGQGLVSIFYNFGSTVFIFGTMVAYSV